MRPPISVTAAPQLRAVQLFALQHSLASGVRGGPHVKSMLYDAYEVQRSLLTSASKLAGPRRRLAQQSRQSLGLQLDGAGGVREPRGVRPRRRAARQAGVRDRCRQGRAQDRSRCARKSCSTSRSATSSISSRIGAEPGAPLLIVAPMSGHYATLAARHGRADAAQARRLHHRLGGRQDWCRWRRASSTSTIISII